MEHRKPIHHMRKITFAVGTWESLNLHPIYGLGKNISEISERKRAASKFQSNLNIRMILYATQDY